MGGGGGRGGGRGARRLEGPGRGQGGLGPQTFLEKLLTKIKKFARVTLSGRGHIRGELPLGLGVYY